MLPVHNHFIFQPAFLCKISAYLWGWVMVNSKKTTKLNKTLRCEINKLLKFEMAAADTVVPRWPTAEKTTFEEFQEQQRRMQGKDAGPSKFRRTLHKKNIWQVSLKRVWRNSSAVNIRQRTSGRSWQLDKNGWLVVSVLSLSSPILWWIITGKWVKAASSCVVYVQLTQKLNENVWKSVYSHCSLKDSSKTGGKKN